MGETTGVSRAVVLRLLALTVILLVAFRVGLWMLPGVTHAVAARSIYNYRDMADLASKEGDYDGAVRVLERAAREVPRDIYFERPEFMFDQIGRIRKQQGRVADSLEAFLRAQTGYFRNIELQGYYPPPRLIRDIIQAYFELGNPEGAYNEARHAMDLYPMLQEQFVEIHKVRMMEDPRIMRNLGLLEIKRGGLAPARNPLRQSLVREPRLDGSHYWLGRIAEKLSVSDWQTEAGKEYEAELVNCPYSDSAITQLIALYLQRGQDPAYQVYRREEMHSKALATFPSNPETTAPLAILLAAGDSKEYTFSLPTAGKLYLSILGYSSPCHGVYGWLEVRLDGQHVQTVYLDHTNLEDHGVWFKHIEAGSHSISLVDLTDAMEGSEDRNIVLQNIWIYRVSEGPS